MINGVMFLQSFSSFAGGGIGDFLSELEQQGFFAYLLPFLLIFAVIFGILSRVKLFADSKQVNGIIALAVGLLALQFDYVPLFFSELFPRFAIGLTILLGLLIIVGLFVDPEEPAVGYGLLLVGAIIFIIVLIKTSGAISFGDWSWWNYNWKMIAGVVVVLIAIAIIVAGSTPKTRKYNPFMARGAGGAGI